MYLTRTIENRFVELFRQGHVKGTVILSQGNEATDVGMTLPLRGGKDVVSLLHRDCGAHLVLGLSPYTMLCQYMANAESPTHGLEGNVHHGDAAGRRLPMISHLGNMLAPAVGAVWAARRAGEDSLGLAVIGDGGSSTGDFHESINLASVRRSPVLFVIQDNSFAFSTPTQLQFNCATLADRAAGYGIPGKTVDGTDAWAVYCSVCDALEQMQATSLPYILECKTVRLLGHAAYDQAEYVTAAQREQAQSRDPLKKARLALSSVYGFTEEKILALEKTVDVELEEAVQASLRVSRPSPHVVPGAVFAPSLPSVKLPPFTARNVKNGNAVTLAQEYLLTHNPAAFLIGQDIGPYGSAFKTCKGLSAKFGPERVIDMPICESATAGFALGASQTGGRPIMEFQFADFGTEAVTQLGLNAATWFYRSGCPAPLLVRMPCGGGITLGAFHSGEFEGLWSRFPGLKLLYPSTPQETFEALVAGFHDPNPCIVFEHKLLYWSKGGDIAFEGSLEGLLTPRQYCQGAELTIVATGAMVEAVLAVVKSQGFSADVWNPFILSPLFLDPIIESVKKTGRLLVVQESGQVAGLGNHILAQVCQAAFADLKCAPRLVGAPDTPVPFARELESHYLPDKDRIRREVDILMGGKG
jgi:2-oxoisovalerate dehydrogenase E1 component